MPGTLLKTRLHPNKHKPKIKQEVNNTKSMHIFIHLNKNIIR